MKTNDPAAQKHGSASGAPVTGWLKAIIHDGFFGAIRDFKALVTFNWKDLWR